MKKTWLLMSIFASAMVAAGLAGCPTVEEVGPVADFEADVTSGPAPLTVQFTDLSNPGDLPISTWRWIFGDGMLSQESSPTHIYTKEGTYTVSLTVSTTSQTDTETKTGYIVVGDSGEGEGEGEGQTEGEGEGLTEGEGLAEGEGEGEGETETVVVINEFLAENDSGITDEDGARSDWLELRNAGGSAVNLAGWTLTDDPDAPSKWVLPSVTIEGGGYLLIWASGKDRTPLDGGELHANFRLSSAGEYLGLRDAEGVLATEWYPFSTQAPDVSYGLLSSGEYSYLKTPTPGAANDETSVASIVAGFEAEPLSGHAPLEVRFTNRTVTETVTGISYVWNFGDGSTSVETSPMHLYETPGLYDVSMTVQYNGGTISVEQQELVEVLSGTIRINEFLALNELGLQDEDVSPQDWIELYNPTDSAVDLAGWSLSDDANTPGKWIFPAVTIEAGGYLVVFASGKDRIPTDGSPLHTNFRLGSGGEYLGLFSSLDPVTVVTEFAPSYPAQTADTSYAYAEDTGDYDYATTPTPGAANE